MTIGDGPELSFWQILDILRDGSQVCDMSNTECKLNRANARAKRWGCSAALIVLLLAAVMILSGCGGKKSSGMSTSGQRSVNDVLQSGMDSYDGKGGADQPGTTGADNGSGQPDASGADDPFITTGSMDHVSGDGLLDLTKLTGNMLFAEVFNIVAAPGEYLGEQIRMTGSVFIVKDPDSGAVRYGCLMQDALGCCSQGFEFRLKNGKYPKAETQITVTGTLDIYEDENNMYCFLKDAVLE